jgi:surface carbohydrate biosynthesis protein
MKILGRQIRLGDPKPADIVIFDEDNSHLVRRVLNAKYSIVVFNQRPEDIWIGVGIFVNIIRNLGCFQFKDALVHRRGIVIGAIKQLQFVYFKACLDAIKPKAVITYIDNSSNFGWLSKYCRQYPFIAIQNGSRLSYAASHDSGYHVQHFFCFGEHEIFLFPKLGYQVENFYPVGSLVASLCYKSHAYGIIEKYDLLIVSTWRGNIGFQQDVKDTMRSMEVMDNFLAKYIRESDIKAAVILRVERDSEHWIMPEVGMSEEKYYQLIYGNCIEIIETNPSIRNIFPLMQESQVIVSCLSSALMEAFGIGKKILYCNFTGVGQYHQDIDPSLVTSDDSYESFSKRLDDLLKVSSIEYLQHHQELRKYYMSYPEYKLTYQAITEKIDEIIKKVNPLNVQ